MQSFEDYYEILGVSQTATSEEIKRAFLDKSYLLHPDRLAGVPQSAKNMAEAELKKVNVAYDTLKDERTRKDYDLEWRRINEKTKPAVEPPVLRFDNVKPHEIQTGTFVIRNLGGPYQKINISNPNSWLKIARWASLSDSDELPLRVEIEAEGKEWGKSYLEDIYVTLDDVAAKVTVQLQTMPEPAFKLVQVSSTRKVSPQSNVAPTPKKEAKPNKTSSREKRLLGLLTVLSVIGALITGLATVTNQLQPPWVGAIVFIAFLAVTVVLAKLALT